MVADSQHLSDPHGGETEAFNGGEGVRGMQRDSEGKEREASELEHLEKLKKNYAMLYPSEDEDRGQRAEDKGQQPEEEDKAEDNKKKLMKKQGFVNYTEGKFFERSVLPTYE